MNKLLCCTVAGMMLLSACAQNTSKPSGSGTAADPDRLTGQTDPDPGSFSAMPAADAVVAMVRGKPITANQLQQPIFEAYGLRFLLQLVQLEMAQHLAQEAGVLVTAEDIANERNLILEQMFGAALERDRFKGTDAEWEQFRRKQFDSLLMRLIDQERRFSLQEFDLGVQSAAHLRKTASAQVKDKITEQGLREAFAIEYGEKVHVRHIQVQNLQELAEVRRRLDAGEKFEDIARALSRNERTRRDGGLIRPFSRAERLWPEEFKNAAFDLRNPGDLSEAVQTGDAIHLIRLEERIPPSRAVKFEDHREILREKIHGLMVQVRMGQLRQLIANDAQKVLVIRNPALRAQWTAELERRAGVTAQDPEQVRQQLQMEHMPATRPSTQPSDATGRLEVARPPATMPGE